MPPTPVLLLRLAPPPCRELLGLVGLMETAPVAVMMEWPSMQQHQWWCLVSSPECDKQPIAGLDTTAQAALDLG